MTLRRRQVPLRLAFAMTMNKSQSQTLKKVVSKVSTPCDRPDSAPAWSPEPQITGPHWRSLLQMRGPAACALSYGIAASAQLCCAGACAWIHGIAARAQAGTRAEIKQGCWAGACASPHGPAACAQAGARAEIKQGCSAGACGSPHGPAACTQLRCAAACALFYGSAASAQGDARAELGQSCRPMELACVLFPSTNLPMTTDTLARSCIKLWSCTAAGLVNICVAGTSTRCGAN